MRSLAFPPRSCLYTACILIALGGSHALAQTTSNTPANNTAVTSKKVSDPKEIAPVVAEQPKAASAFSVDVGVPAWASAINGVSGVKGVSGNVHQSFSSLWDHMDWIVPLAVDARYQKWGFHLDGQIVQLAQRFDTRGVLYNSGTLTMQQAFANFNLNYQVVDTERWKVNTSIGGRYNYLSLSGTLQSKFPGPVPDQDETGSVSWVDPILGLDTKVHIYKPLSLEMLEDVGGFGVGSHITYQFYGGANVQLTRSMYMDVGYRYVYTNYSEGGNTYNVAAKGPQLVFGVNF